MESRIEESDRVVMETKVSSPLLSTLTLPFFKISLLEKLTFIFASFSPTSLNILPQTFYHSIYKISLLYTSLVILLS